MAAPRQRRDKETKGAARDLRVAGIDDLGDSDLFIAGTAVPPLNDLTPLTPGRAGVGYASFAILLLILMPLPHALWSAAGLYCPYL